MLLEVRLRGSLLSLCAVHLQKGPSLCLSCVRSICVLVAQVVVQGPEPAAFLVLLVVVPWRQRDVVQVVQVLNDTREPRPRHACAYTKTKRTRHVIGPKKKKMQGGSLETKCANNYPIFQIKKKNERRAKKKSIQGEGRKKRALSQSAHTTPQWRRAPCRPAWACTRTPGRRRTSSNCQTAP